MSHRTFALTAAAALTLFAMSCDSPRDESVGTPGGSATPATPGRLDAGATPPGAVPDGGLPVAGESSPDAPVASTLPDGAPAPSVSGDAATTCAADDKSCQGNVLRTCKAGSAPALTTCDQGCNAVILDCNKCKPNQRSCGPAGSVSCNQDGTGSTALPCPTGCNQATG